MTVGMLLATILLVLTFSGVLSGAWERLGIRQRTAGAWLLAMLAALLMPDVRLGAARVNPAGLAVTAAASVRLMMTIRPRRELVRVLLGSVIAGAMGLLVLILSEARAEQSPAPTERTPKAPLPGADSPYQGEMSRRDKRGRDAGSAQPRLRGCRKFA